MRLFVEAEDGARLATVAAPGVSDWTWTRITRKPFPAGTTRLVFSGEADLKIDRILLASDDGFQPAGKGNGDETPPGRQAKAS